MQGVFHDNFMGAHSLLQFAICATIIMGAFTTT